MNLEWNQSALLSGSGSFQRRPAGNRGLELFLGPGAHRWDVGGIVGVGQMLWDWWTVASRLLASQCF